jgi:hypothetical protein
MPKMMVLTFLEEARVAGRWAFEHPDVLVTVHRMAPPSGEYSGRASGC